MPYTPFATQIETTLEIRAAGICIAEIDCTVHLIEDADSVCRVEAIQIDELGGEAKVVMMPRAPQSSLFWQLLEQCNEKANRDDLQTRFLEAAAGGSYQLMAA
ncbi:hypothetical protein [Roseibium algae]|uniref:Uncharacterized protein n=1 Tax=Roseibium algae TaxID=3123038 RepID=A0ABU8TQJ2_9HYPH